MFAATILAAGLVAAGQDAPADSSAFTNHGVAAPVSRARGIAATAGKDGRPVVLAWLSDHRGCSSMLMIDAVTGQTQQVAVPPTDCHDSPFAVLLSSKGRFYSLFGFRFMEFDPKQGRFTFVGKTRDRVAMSMTEDANGVVWAATYPKSHAVSFDPRTGKLTDYGSLNKESWPQYPRAMAVDAAGWVYLGIGNTASQIAALDPKTGKALRLVKPENRKHGRGHVYLAKDGKVYAHGHSKDPWYTLLAGQRTPVEGEPNKLPAEPVVIKASHQGAVFRDFPDGRAIVDIDIPEHRLVVKDPKADKPREVRFKYASEGSHILSMVLGPDGKIHGSTGHPLRVYHFDPATGACTNNGLLSYNGHWNAVTVQRGRIYSGQYGGGLIWEFDPARPWADRDSKAPNPRRLCGSAPPINRPHSLLAHPDGRHIILTGTPGYGLTGGGMHIVDLQTGKRELLTHKQLIENQATMCLIALPGGLLAGGTTVSPGTGGATLAKEAELYLMDFAKRQVVWRQAVLPGTAHIRDLILGPDGLVYGVASGSIFFVFDPAQRKLVHKADFKAYGAPSGGQAPRSLLVGPDKKLYSFFTDAIVRIEPGTFKHKRLAKPPVPIQIGIVLHKGRLYFASSSNLWSYKVAGLE